MYNLNVLVNGRPVRTYRDPYGGIWVEGREGHQFTLQVKNYSWKRIVAVVSVDGLNVINGKHESPDDSPGYIVSRNGDIKIPGWKINQNEVREFYFTGSDRDSYVRKVGGNERNIGVIAAAIYPEKQYYSTYNVWPKYDYSYGTGGDYTYRKSYSYEPLFSSTGDVRRVNMVQCSASNHSTSDDWSKQTNTVSVGSGRIEDFKTNTVNFDRESQSAMLVIRYDTYDGLVRRGVIQDNNKQPQPFPMTEYCPNV